MEVGLGSMVKTADIPFAQPKRQHAKWATELNAVLENDGLNRKTGKQVIFNFYRAMHFSAYARSWDRMSSVCL